MLNELYPNRFKEWGIEKNTYRIVDKREGTPFSKWLLQHKIQCQTIDYVSCFLLNTTVHEISGIPLLTKLLERSTLFQEYCSISFINRSAPSWAWCDPFANAMLQFNTSPVNTQTAPG